ncbi:helix-turn-helix domain-containing protein [Microbispora rosea]|uniref:helix-turn-helix domain-containing protein n=1 Tax=Microbispora rosea TaxID=58117 RepID=UPI0037A4C17E
MTHQHRMPASPEDLARIADVRAMCASGEARRIREMARVTLREVAAAIGVDHKTIVGWETGRTTCVSPYALAYADALNAMARVADPNGAALSRSGSARSRAEAAA